MDFVLPAHEVERAPFNIINTNLFSETTTEIMDK
jgi:hypothetical protein